MKKRHLLLWAFLQVWIALAIAQPDTNMRISSLKIPQVDLSVAHDMETQLRTLQKQALDLRLPAAVYGKAKVQAAENGKKIYGFLEYDEKTPEKGIVEFSLNNLQTYEFLYKTNGFTICAGAYANNRFYYYAYTIIYGHTLPLGFYEIDLETGESVMLKDYSSLSSLFGDMTYDYSTNTMWAYTETDEGPQLWTIDIATGDCKLVAIIKNTLSALAADGSGTLYGVAKTGDFYSINKIDGTMTCIGATGIRPASLQSMEFDRSNNVLYWAAGTSENKGILATIDIKTGKATSLGTLGNNSQILGLFIPYVPSELKAPEAPADLTVTTEGNADKALLEWTNPAKDVDGNDLGELLNVKIYREGVLIETLENPVMGAKASYQDTEVPTGLMTYAVTASNKAGESSSISVKKYVGRDVPAAPVNLSVTKLSDNSARLSWGAPAAGFNGGWLDTSTLTYKVTRYPDEVVLTESTAAITIDDTNITEFHNYYYLVQAFNVDGEGDMAMTERISLGNPYTIPYDCSFGTKDEFNQWLVINHNQDQSTWQYNTYTAEYKAGYSDMNPADDWLISPPVRLEKDEAYKMSFDAVTGGTIEKLRINFGKEATVESLSTVLDDSEYTSTDTVKKTVYLPQNIEAGNYRIGLYVHSDAGQWYIHINNVRIEKSDAGEITGNVTGNSAPVKDCLVTVKETGAKAVTDEQGNYRLINVEAGAYTLVWSAIGYETQEKAVTVQKKAVSMADCVLASLPKHTVTGKLADETGNPLVDMHVRIGGYADFEATTNAKGVFTVENVYEAEAYTLTVQEDNYYYYTRPFGVGDKDVDLGTVALKEKVLPPYGIVQKEENKQGLVSWQKPVSLMEFRYDDGTISGKYTMTYMDDRAVCGVAYHAPALLNSVSWYLPEAGNAGRDTVNIYVFALDENGVPANRIIYSVKGVPTRLEAWSTYYFPEEVYASDGYMVALGVKDGDLSVGLDSGSLPFTDNTQYMTYDGFDSFYAMQSWDIENKNLMIRANGTPTADMETTRPAPTADAYTYKVWRFAEGEANNETSWVSLTSEAQKNTACADAAWDELAQGIYRYAVKSISPSGAVSVPSFSKSIYKDMFAAVKVRIDTNTKGKSADGATVTLYNENKVYSDTVRGNDQILFDQVWKGIYSLKIVLPGYVTIEKSDLDFSKNPSYETEVYTLQEIIEKPYNISVEKTANAGERLLKWDNGLFDNFELHSDFTINSPGHIGWTYIDGDESTTTGSAIFEFPGMGEKMAYVVMNCKKTVENDTVAYSGNKYLATFSAESGRNNDFIISPELNTDKSFKISFYARSYEGAFGLETFRVGYSAGGGGKEDFTWVGSKQNPPVGWTRYEFTVPAVAKRVAINCISMGQYILMLDDIFIEAEAAQPVENDYSYELYLNGKSVGQTEDNSYLLQNLAKGDYKASVRRMYASGESDFAELDFTVDESGESIQNIESEIRIYPNPAADCFCIEGEYTGVQVIDQTGKVVIDRDGSDNCIKVEKLPEGFYLVRVTNAKEVMIRKILVKK